MMKNSIQNRFTSIEREIVLLKLQLKNNDDCNTELRKCLKNLMNAYNKAKGDR